MVDSRFDGRLLADHVRRLPSMAFSSADGRQYVVSGPWRHRDDIAELIEASRGALRPELVEAVADSLVRIGYRLLILDYSVEANDPAFFRGAQFQLVERILEYERFEAPIDIRPLPGRFAIRPYNGEERPEVLQVEKKSFPWLWWNSYDEWDRYVVTPGVEVLVGWVDDRVVGYAGFSVHRRDGHLDRLAVAEDVQGRGLGASLLAASLARMAERGARDTSLTTQEQNIRSQKLYEQNGFRRGRWGYDIFGRWLDATKGTVR